MHGFRSGIVVSVIALCGLLAAPGPAGAQLTPERIRSFHADIRIQPSGTIRVVEEIEYDFNGFERHGIYREIAVRLPYDGRYERIYPLEM